MRMKPVPRGTTRSFLRVLWISALVLIVGTVGYMAIEDAPPLDALYMTVITVTTIGYREVFPLSTAGRWFTMFLALAGVGIMLYVVSIVAAVIVETDVRRVLGLRRERRMTKELSNHIVVCGAGRTGHALAEILAAKGAIFVVVDTDPRLCRELEGSGVHVVDGDATTRKALEAAGITHASTLIACLGDDAHNVYTILLARQLNPQINIVARALEEGSEERLRLAGADRIFNPYRTGAMRLAYTALKPTVIDFLDASLPGSGNGGLELAEIRVRDNSRLAGQTLAGANVRHAYGVIVVGVRRGEESTFNPPPGMEIQGGDVLVALGPTEGLEALERASS